MKFLIISIFFNLIFINNVSSNFTSAAQNKKAPPQQRNAQTQRFVNELSQIIKEKDDLGARAYIIKNKGVRLGFDDWLSIRELLNARPQMGYDFIRIWDRFSPKSARAVYQQKMKMDQALNRADKLMEAKRFGEAFRFYQRIAKVIKKHFDVDQEQNGLIYYSVLHSMGRALYSAGQFDDAIEVYQWIRPFYPKYRQVLFEQMWAAFRADKVDLALGAISSQRAQYFSEYLDPEVYLLEIYLYKKLCRDAEAKTVIDAIKKFKSQIQSGAYDFKEWAKSDIETRALLHLIEADISQQSERFISNSERNKEKARIQNGLQKQFSAERKRIIEQLKLVEAYSGVAVNIGSKSLRSAQALPTREAWFEAGFEIWPAEDTEYWLDEIGNRRFLGESLCIQNSKP